MKQILIIEVSPRGTDSASRAVSETLTARLAAEHPEAKIIRRDLATDLVPHLDFDTLRAIASRDPEDAVRFKPAGRLSDEMTDELLGSDLLVISTPMWNFGIPSALKAWIDLVVRPGRTFQYAAGGVDGMAKGAKAILVLSSGGIFSEGPWAEWDYVEPYLRRILGFIGIDNVQTVRAQGLNLTEFAPVAVPTANRAVEQLVV
jgi:FMN-dependent NADH-azoreductase